MNGWHPYIINAKTKTKYEVTEPIENNFRRERMTASINAIISAKISGIDNILNLIYNHILT